ncbi:MAG: hypothetical protein ACFFB5_18535 [Promethearchaeota archaeon]
MIRNGLSLKDNDEQREVNQLKEYLKLANGTSEHVLIAKWRCIKHMQSDLELPSQTPIDKLVKLYNNLEEIRKAFNYQINDFSQLNELFHDVTAVRDRLNFPKDYSTTDVLSRLNSDLIPFLGLKENSLLKQLLLLYQPNQLQIM